MARMMVPRECGCWSDREHAAARYRQGNEPSHVDPSFAAAFTAGLE
jgi:hypothetical protein